MSAPRPRRVAMFGPICHTGGSSAMALFGVVEEWLRTGWEIDFFSPGNWIDPAGLVAYDNFRFVNVPLAPWKRFTRTSFDALSASRRTPRAIRSALLQPLNLVQQVAHIADLVARVRREHVTRKYDAYVSINRASSASLADVMPLVSWAQASPRCESEFIVREGALTRKECGVTGWAILRGGYAVKDAMISPGFHRSTGIIVASEWSRSMWIREGIPADRLRVIPFPVDVDRFQVTERPAKRESFVFLWAGRIVPRKRFPLALEAFAKLRERRPGARLLIAGGPGYQTFLPDYRLPPLVEGAERLGSIPTAEMPALLARTDVIFQPSENETGAAAPVEGLASGIPSVIGPTNGTGDCLLETAFRFDRYTSGAIAEAMERAMDAVLADPKGIAHRARAMAERTAALPVIAARGADVVNEFIDQWHAERRPRAARGRASSLQVRPPTR